jgi:hypothetical protein
MFLHRPRGWPPPLVASSGPVRPLAVVKLSSLLAWLILGSLIGSAPAAEAASRRARSPAKARSSAKAKHSSRATRVPDKAKATGGAGEDALAGTRVAVFSFEGEDTYSVRDHVIQALTARGLKVEATLRPVDTTEQFRDMGAALDLAVYVHGHVKQLPADHAVATIVIRSGVTGRKVGTFTFTGYRRGLPFDVEEKVWDRVSTVFTRACAEASKPGARHHSRPMVIEAGTPLP